VRARDGGVLVRTGQTEGSVDLCKLAGLEPAAAMIEVMNDDGTMARRPELLQLCEKLNLKMCSVADVVAYRLSRETLVRRAAERDLHSEYGAFHLITYASGVDPFPHAALCRGRVGREPIDDPVLVRVHAQNVLGDVFGDLSNPTARSLIQSLKRIDQAGEGALIYIRQDDLGAGLNHLPGVSTEGQSADRQAVDEVLTALRRDARFNVGIGSQIIRDLGIRRLRLLTDHPQQYHALDGFDLEVSEFVGLGVADDL
jgi:3,4-dihydroxy 2-butanone 4-phosphate synthase/GTP cyclohydrolase II